MSKLLNEDEVIEIIKGENIYFVEKKKSYFIQLPYDKAEQFAKLLCEFWINDKELNASLTSNKVIINLSEVLPNVLININKVLEKMNIVKL